MIADPHFRDKPDQPKNLQDVIQVIRQQQTHELMRRQTEALERIARRLERRQP